MSSSVELEIVKRILRPEAGDMSVDVARYFLGVRLSDFDRERMTELGIKANRGTIAQDEKGELDSYIRVCDLLSILQAKARLSLKTQSSAA
jgi:hypothetical protein